MKTYFIDDDLNCHELKGSLEARFKQALGSLKTCDGHTGSLGAITSDFKPKAAIQIAYYQKDVRPKIRAYLRKHMVAQYLELMALEMKEQAEKEGV